MKKVIFGILAIVFAIALVVGGYIFITSRNLQKYSEVNAPCPYTWQELRSGAYRLEINTAAYPDCSWDIQCYPKNVVAVSSAGSDSEIAAFSILPLNMGQTYVQVFCEQTEPYSVRLFEIGLQILVSDDFKITMEKTEHKVFDGVSVLGEGSDFPIRWWKDPDGIANLLIEGQHIDNWEILSYDQDGIEVSGPFYRTGSCGFEIRGKLPGSYPLAICDGVENELRLEIQVAEDLAAAVESVVAEAYAVDRSAEHAALEAVVGDKVSLPAQASVVCYSVKTASGTVKFRLEDRQWHWNISKDQTAEELVGDLAENASETKTVSRGDITFKAYAFDDGVAVCWKNGNVAMLVTGESGAALSDALELAEQLSEANHG